MNKIRRQLDILAKNGTTFHENALGILDEEPINGPHCENDKSHNMEEIINKIPKLWDNNNRFCMAYHDCYWQIGYVDPKNSDSWLAHPIYQTKSGETLFEGLIKFKELL
jgi:hypothetical protein